MKTQQPNSEHKKYLQQAIELSRQCPPSKSAFSVGAILLNAQGIIIGTGYSRERSESDHAEEVAFQKAAEAGKDPSGGTLYSSLEPCGQRASRPICCAQHIINAKLHTVVFAQFEPSTFVNPVGYQKLKQAQINVIVIDELAAEFNKINRHIFGH